MGEQTLQTQPQPQIISHPDPTTTTTTTTTPITPPAQEPPHQPQPQPQPQTRPSSSKIPFRPRKIRKLSPENPTTKSPPQPIKTIIPRIIARRLSSDGEIAKALKHLKSSDPQLVPIIDSNQPPTFDSFHPPFLALTKSILYQQLAFKAGTSIYTRFISLCGGEAGVLPETVLSLSTHQLRQIGVSARKASYLHDLANKYRNGILSDSSIVAMDDKSLFTMLTMVKGIGSWSVHMFMIFSLHRPDVLPIGDLGVRKGVQLLYGLEQLPRPSQMEHLCQKWRPYRSVASWYMWRFAESRSAPVVNGGVDANGNNQQQPPHQQQPLPLPQPQTQPQLLDPLNSITNLGERGSSKIMLDLCEKDMYTGVASRACAWSQ